MWSKFEICPDLLKLIRRDTASRLSWYLPSTHIAGILQMLPWSPQLFKFVTIRFLLGKLPWAPNEQDHKICCCAFLVSCPPPTPPQGDGRWDERRGGHLSPLLKLFPGWNLIGGKVPISLCTCKISCATSITLVISYATAIRSEWSVGLSFTTFRWGYHFIYFFPCSQGHERGPVRGRGGRGCSLSVSGPLQALWTETKEDSCRCLNGPAHMKWLTDTHTAVCWH